MRDFTEKDVNTWQASDGRQMYSIYTNDSDFTSVTDLVYAPLDWQKRGLQQTASGYGSKLTSPYKISFEGKLYRIYTTIYGNIGSNWFLVRGRKIFVS